MLHQLHVLRQAPHRRAALAVERNGEEFAVAAGRDEGAEGLALEEADARELGGRDAGGAGEELAWGHGGRGARAALRAESTETYGSRGICSEAEFAIGACVGRKMERR